MKLLPINGLNPKQTNKQYHMINKSSLSDMLYHMIHHLNKDYGTC